MLHGSSCCRYAALVALTVGLGTQYPREALSSGRERVQSNAARSSPHENSTLKLAGPRSGIQTIQFVVVRSEKALAELIKKHNPFANVDRKKVDFKKQTVVAYFAGSKPTGGFSVELMAVDRNKASARVRFRLLKPGKGSAVTEALTSPFLIEAIDKLPAKVTHTVTEEERAPK